MRKYSCVTSGEQLKDLLSLSFSDAGPLRACATVMGPGKIRKPSHTGNCANLWGSSNFGFRVRRHGSACRAPSSYPSDQV